MSQILEKYWRRFFTKAAISISSFRCMNYDCFADRHIGLTELEKQQMLFYLGFKVKFYKFVKIMINNQKFKKSLVVIYIKLV